jgi:3-oxoacyl-[acyl-carrier-protein] synthase III
MSSGVEIIGLGHYAPERAVRNEEIELRLGLEAGWIARRTGIHERRYAADGEALTDIASAAGDMALRSAGLARNRVTLTLLATSTPDYLLPPSAPLLAHRLGLASSGGIDLAGACAGFVYALALADGFVRTHRAPVLVVAANILSRRINPDERGSAILFADAAGAVLLAPTERTQAGVRGVRLASSGADYGLIQIPAGGSVRPFAPDLPIADTRMVISDGKAVFAKAIAMMVETSRAAMAAAGLEPSHIAHLIPHQANARMTSAVAHQLGIARYDTLSTIALFGNSSAATIPFTLSVLAAERRYAHGDALLMTAAGAGLTGGSLVWGW